MRFRLVLIALLVLMFGVAAVNAQTLATIFVPELATVRSGPGTVYDRLGELTANQTADALGKSVHSDWVQIEYSGSPNGRGWVFANYVEVRGSTLEALPIADAPPTATLPPTPDGETNPFIVITPPITQQPTFTPAPPPVELPQYTETTLPPAPFPPAAMVLSLLAVGLLGIIMAIIRRNA